MKNVIITGANQGIGYYLVKQLLIDGFNVSVLDIQTDNLEKLRINYQKSLLPLRCDIREDAAVKDCVKRSAREFGGIDYAIHNACICTFDSMEDTDDKTYKDVFDVNYFGALRLTKAVVPYMKEQGKGSVIYTSSGVGVMGFVNISPYASSKGAIESLAKCMNIEFAGTGITFHIFQPPLTRTKSSSPLPVPNEFMADPEVVGTGLAKRISKKKFIISHSVMQSIQTKMAYLFPVKFGKLLSKMTADYQKEQEK